MLLNWFSQSIPASLTTSFNDNDLTALTSQYCTNLLMAGIIKPLDGNNDNSFKVSCTKIGRDFFSLNKKIIFRRI
jgi:hypothetical protein